MAEGFDRYPANAAADAAELMAADAAAKAAAATAAMAGMAPPITETVNKKAETQGGNYHEAGYDAYITGQAFLRFAGFILKERERETLAEEEGGIDIDEGGRVGAPFRKRRKVQDSRESLISAVEDAAVAPDAFEALATAGDNASEDGEVEETELEREEVLRKRKYMILDNPTQLFLEDAELKDCYNLLHMMRSDIEAMNLSGPEEEPQDRPFNFLLRNVPSHYTTSALFHLFRPFNAHRFNRVDSTSAWLLISRYAAPPPTDAGAEPVETLKSSTMLDTPEVAIPLGPLGKEFVAPLMIGDSEMANKGRLLGLTSLEEAAAIEVVDWKSWYRERDAAERQARETQKNMILEQELLRQRQAEEHQRQFAQQREQRDQQRLHQQKPANENQKTQLKRKQDDAGLDPREDLPTEVATIGAPRAMTTAEAVAALEAALDAE